jgi:hypothetical protein
MRSSRRPAPFSVSATSTFIVCLRHGVWHVTLNGQFFGDYRTEHFAMEGVAQAQRKLSAPAKIVRKEDNDPL